MTTKNSVLVQSTSDEERQPPLVSTVRKVNQRSSTIALFIFGGIGNLGNDASLEAMIETVSKVRPTAQIVCICAEPDVVAEVFGLPAVPIYWPAPSSLAYKIANLLSFRQLGHLRAWYRTLSFAGTLDGLILPGTGMLDDFGLSPGGFPYRLFMWCASAKARGVPVAFVSTGAGPITHRANRLLMLSAARLASYRSYRDKVSSEFMQSHGFDDGAGAVFPDLVLGLPLEKHDTSGPPSDRQSPAQPKTIGIGVMDYYGWANSKTSGAYIHRRYVGSLVQLIAELGRRGHGVRLLVGTQDEPMVGELEAALGLADVGIDEPWIETRSASSLSEHATHISGTDIVVGTRYHTVIASLMLRRPTIALGYADKFEAVMADFGQRNFCNNAETFEVEHVLAQIEELSDDYGNVRSSLADTLSAAKARLAEQEEKLAGRILVEP